MFSDIQTLNSKVGRQMYGNTEWQWTCELLYISTLSSYGLSNIMKICHTANNKEGVPLHTVKDVK
jgi:hypothetical protein